MYLPLNGSDYKKVGIKYQLSINNNNYHKGKIGKGKRNMKIEVNSRLKIVYYCTLSLLFSLESSSPVFRYSGYFILICVF